MRKIFFVLVSYAAALVLSAGYSFAAEKAANHLYEIDLSTSTPVHGKRAIEMMSERRMARVAAARASSAFKFGNIYTIPNPAMGIKHPVIHIEAGAADKVEIKIYDPSGKFIEQTVLTSPVAVNNGICVYEYRFLSNDTPGGTCAYTVKAYKAGKDPIEGSGKIIFVKTWN